jgi:hypothetical protein
MNYKLSILVFAKEKQIKTSVFAHSRVSKNMPSEQNRSPCSRFYKPSGKELTFSA